LSGSTLQIEEVRTMWFLMPIPIFLAVAAVLLGVLTLGRRLFPGTYTAKRAFWCPFRERRVNVDFKQQVWDSSLSDVVTCSAFSPPHAVLCEKSCLLLGQFPATRAEAAAPAR
jgi:hypothetical protein